MTEGPRRQNDETSSAPRPFAREIAAYAAFAVSAIACGYFSGDALLRRSVQSMPFFVFFLLCATVLPFLIRKPSA